MEVSGGSTSDPTGQFKSFWRPISSLDINIWHRWLHAHRIHAILHHDNPLPKNLLQANNSGRYTAIQSMKAMVQLCQALRSWSSFILVDQTTFIRFIWDDDEFRWGHLQNELHYTIHTG